MFVPFFASQKANRN